MGRHESWELKQMQSLPLEAKVRMTKQRIKVWYESWFKYEIHNKKTGKVRVVTATEEPYLKDDEYIGEVFDGQVCVSFSGGKDSTVLKHIVDSMYDNVPAVFVNTGLEYPEIQKFVKDVKSGKHDCFNSDVEIIRPEMRFDEVIKKYGYPVITKRISQTIYYAKKSIAQGKETERTKLLNGDSKMKNGEKSLFNCSKWEFIVEAPFDVSDKCCDVMKKKPLKRYQKESGRLPITAQMASESLQRRNNWIRHGCNVFEGISPISNPMSFWTEQDILQYIKKYNVPYCSVYGDIVVDETKTDEMLGQLSFDERILPLTTTGCKRTGCMYCLFGVHREKSPNRLEQMKTTHPKTYDYIMRSELEGGLNYKFVIDWFNEHGNLNIKY